MEDLLVGMERGRWARCPCVPLAAPVLPSPLLQPRELPGSTAAGWRDGQLIVVVLEGLGLCVKKHLLGMTDATQPHWQEVFLP